MLVYGIILIAVGIILLVLSILLCLGHIELLHSYHRNHVKPANRKKFALSQGLSLLVMTCGFFAAGIIGIVLQNEIGTFTSLTILIGTMLISITLLLFFIVKYNGKIFG